MRCALNPHYIGVMLHGEDTLSHRSRDIGVGVGSKRASAVSTIRKHFLGFVLMFLAPQGTKKLSNWCTETKWLG